MSAKNSEDHMSLTLNWTEVELEGKYHNNLQETHFAQLNSADARMLK